YAITDLSADGAAAETFPAADGGYVVRPAEPDAVRHVLEPMLGDDPHRARREELRVYYLGDLPRERYADAFVEALRAELLRRAVSPVGAGRRSRPVTWAGAGRAPRRGRPARTRVPGSCRGSARGRADAPGRAGPRRASAGPGRRGSSSCRR